MSRPEIIVAIDPCGIRILIKSPFAAVSFFHGPFLRVVSCGHIQSRSNTRRQDATVEVVYA